jgi:alkylhydroperoxidase family enzyme
MKGSRLLEVLRATRGKAPPAAEVARLRALVPPPAATSPPRVAPARPSELGLVNRVLTTIMGRTTGEGPPNVMTTLARHPKLFRRWLRYSARLMPFGMLPRAEAELVILRVAFRAGSAYEWHQHVLIGLRSGLSVDQVERVAGGPSAVGWSEREAALLSATDELIAVHELSDPTYALLARQFDEQELIELCMLVGNYQGLATALGGLGVQLEGS